MTKRNAHLLRRSGAMLYDGLLVLAMLFMATVPFVVARGGEPVAPNDPWYRVVLLIVVYGFFVGFWSQKGRTLGMQSWALRIETPDGRTPDLAQASLRFLVAIVSWLPLGLGYLWSLFDRERLAWHDRASGTRLVHYRDSRSADPG